MKVTRIWICRDSGVNKAASYHTGEKYEILTGCSNCGKSKKQVQKAFEEGITREIPHE